jgi:hypothetical protein
MGPHGAWYGARPKYNPGGLVGGWGREGGGGLLLFAALALGKQHTGAPAIKVRHPC